MAGEAADPVAWLRAQVEADRECYEAAVLRLDPIVAACEGEPNYVETPLERARMQLADARDHVADCEAKLAILDNHRWIDRDHEHYSGTGCITCDYRGYGHVERFAPRGPVPCLTVRYLLAAYKHRSGYEEQWGAAT